MHQNLKQVLLSALFVFALVATSCKKDKKSEDPTPTGGQVTLPTITTLTVSNITDSSATSGGTITSNGGDNILAAGLCWDTVAGPTISGNKTSSFQNNNQFTTQINNLKPGLTYFVRAYATNSKGTAYGNELSFTTTKSPKWVSWANGLGNAWVYQIISVGNDLYAATKKGVYKSTGGQNNWIQIGLAGVDVNTIIYVNGAFFCGTSQPNGVFYSADGGNTWAARNNGFFAGGLHIIYLASSGNKIYANSYGGGWDEVYMTSDNGLNWSLITNLSGIKVNGLAVMNNTVYFYDAVQQTVKYSNNDGTNWSNFSSLPGSQSDNKLVTMNNKLYACVASGFYLVESSGATKLYSGETSSSNCSAAELHNSVLYIGTYNEVKMNTGGTSWLRVSNGLVASNGSPASVKCLKTFNGSLYAGSNNAGVFKLIE